MAYKVFSAFNEEELEKKLNEAEALGSLEIQVYTRVLGGTDKIITVFSIVVRLPDS